MNKKLFLFLAFLGAAMVVVNSACKKDEEECAFGFEKDADGKCTVEWSAKFEGAYLGYDACPPDTFDLQTPVVVTRISESEIKLTGFAGYPSFINADVTSSDVIDFTYTDPVGRNFVGSATISGDNLTGSYKLTFPSGTVQNCTFNYNK